MTLETASFSMHCCWRRHIITYERRSTNTRKRHNWVHGAKFSLWSSKGSAGQEVTPSYVTQRPIALSSRAPNSSLSRYCSIQSTLKPHYFFNKRQHCPSLYSSVCKMVSSLHIFPTITVYRYSHSMRAVCPLSTECVNFKLTTLLGTQPSPFFRPAHTHDIRNTHTHTHAFPSASATSAADNKTLISALRQETTAVVRAYVVPTKSNARRESS